MSELNCDSTIHIIMYKIKGFRDFDNEFSFDDVIIFEDSLSDIVIIMDATLIFL